LRQVGAGDPNARIVQATAVRFLDLLLEEGLGGRVELVHVDPPFGSEADYARRRTLHAGGEAFALELPSFVDRDAGDVAHYLEALDPVLRRAHALLAPTGALYVHLDFRRAPYVRVLLDEIFGSECLQNDIVWAYALGGSSRDRFQRKHDVILYYTRQPRGAYFDAPLDAATSSMLAGQAKVATDVWRTGSREEDAPIIGAWSDSLVDKTLSNRDSERTGYPTQKPLAIALRMIAASCPSGGLVVDPMCGSGTIGVAALRTGRRAILGDASALAVDTARGRLIGEGACVAWGRDAALEGGTPPVLDASARLRDGLIEVTLEGIRLELPEGVRCDEMALLRAHLARDGRIAITSWGFGKKDCETWRAVAWHDQSQLRECEPAPTTLRSTTHTSPTHLRVVAMDVFGRAFEADVALRS